MRHATPGSPATRRRHRWVIAGLLVAGVVASQPAGAAEGDATSPTNPGSSAPSAQTLSNAAQDLQNAQDKLAKAQVQVRAATARAQQLAFTVVALRAQVIDAQTQVNAVRAATRRAVRDAYDDSLVDPTANLYAALSGQDPQLATDVRDRRMGDAADRARRLQQAVQQLGQLTKDTALREAAADRAAAQAIGAAETAREAAAAAEQTVLEVRQRDQLAAERKELDALNAQLAQTLAALEAASTYSSTGVEINATNLPAYLRDLYMKAATTCPGLPWGVLAGIGQVETDHGQVKAVSSAGAMGPMQFMPSTWAVYGIDGDGDGKADILDQADAVYSAANYLCHSGGGNPSTLYAAIFAYNHSNFYVNTVLHLATEYH